MTNPELTAAEEKTDKKVEKLELAPQVTATQVETLGKLDKPAEADAKFTARMDTIVYDGPTRAKVELTPDPTMKEKAGAKLERAEKKVTKATTATPSGGTMGGAKAPTRAGAKPAPGMRGGPAASALQPGGTRPRPGRPNAFAAVKKSQQVAVNSPQYRANQTAKLAKAKMQMEMAFKPPNAVTIDSR